ncbi:murein biosynthesis integral membrane protein MurJ [Arsenicicoccus sp. oral taxon 190]|uniref:murein biosynthesis integral membrane protein MurJ n=1 Tax=Arsenicicoccus sp. oral taxon 190 TaxID=1658671 RepID=UPI00067A03CB|nr:lipid II flippase MurJ [Arsenicicoccus sp. oral taxon 190]AKT52781.1 hypothetical protein ADJ73_11020 [Arsenicicoccus sp. oral taxon 190]
MSARAVRGLAAASVVIAVLTLLSRVVGFGRWLVFSHEVGATCVGTAYSTANTVPNVLYEVAAGGALAAVAVPVVAGYLAEDDERSADQVVSALLGWAMVVLVPLAALVVLLAGPIATALLGSTPCAGQHALVTRMLWWFAPQIPLYGLGVVAAGALQARRRFAWPAVAPLLSSVVVIVAYLAYGRMSPPAASAASLPAGALTALAGGTTAGVVALSVPLLVPLRRSGFRLRPTLRFPQGAAARARSLALAGVVALLAQQATVLATVWVSNARGGAGLINAYQYLQAVYVLPYAVLAVPVATAVFPSLSQRGGPDAPVEAAVERRLATSVRVVALSGSLGAAVLVAVAPAVGRFFAALDAGRGREGSLDLTRVVDLGLTTFAPGLVGYGLVAVLSRALYVRGRPAVAAGWTALGWLVAAALPVGVTLRATGPTATIVALGVGSALGMTVAGVGLLLAVRRSWGAGAVRGAGRAVLAAAVAVPCAGLVGRLPAGVAPGAPWHGTWGSVALGIGCAAVAVAVWAAVGAVADRSAVARVLRRASSPGR